MKDTKVTSLLTSGFPVAFISMQRGLYLDMSSCTDEPDETGVDKHVHTRSGASFASVPTRVCHKIISCIAGVNVLLWNERATNFFTYK